MKDSILVCTMLTFFSITGFAQVVETIAGPNPRINNGLVVDSNGNIFASDLFGSGFNGSRVHKITPDGNSVLYASGLSQPAGLVFDDSGLLYVAEFTSGAISTVDELGNITRWIRGLNQPADLVFDSSGNLYVTNYGNGTISKVTIEGSVSTLTSGLNQPVGLAIDDSEQLYAANLNDGKIYSIDLDGNKSVLTTIEDTPIGFMTYSSGYLFVTSTGGHKIYRVDMDGNISDFAGTGIPGTNDGEVSVAQFTNPDGIAVSSTGDSLYVSENNSNLLRRIINDTTTGLQETSSPRKELERMYFYPNPAVNFATVQFRLNANSKVELSILSPGGQKILTIFSGYLTKGEYTYPVAVTAIPPGVYLVELKSNLSAEYITLNIL